MCCVFLALMFTGPRLAAIVWWLLQPARFNLIFSNIVMPILGILFLPWTTLMYLILAPGGITGWEWLFFILGVFFDIGSYSGAALKGD